MPCSPAPCGSPVNLTGLDWTCSSRLGPIFLSIQLPAAPQCGQDPSQHSSKDNKISGNMDPREFPLYQVGYWGTSSLPGRAEARYRTDVKRSHGDRTVVSLFFSFFFLSFFSFFLSWTTMVLCCRTKKRELWNWKLVSFAPAGLRLIDRGREGWCSYKVTGLAD